MDKERLQNVLNKLEDLSKSHLIELRSKDKIIDKLQEELRQSNLEVIRLKCKCEKYKTFKIAAEKLRDKYLNSRIYLIGKVLQYRSKLNDYIN